MALTPSNMLALGTEAPQFSLPDTLNDGKSLALGDLNLQKGLLVMFICNHCPYVKHINDELVKLGQDYICQGINMVAISSNNVSTHPEDSPEKMTIYGQNLGYPFPYLYDESQEVAKSFDAACTPDFYLFDANKQLVYRGQLDDSRPGNNQPVTGKDLRLAMDHLLKDEVQEAQQVPSIGCNIKWK
ncbi:MAG: thioredoxin family protein [Cytophagales bacterium]|nr:thioredoxin family protein [Cytophagales bacterium]